MVSKSRIQSDFLGPHGKEETQVIKDKFLYLTNNE
jgi:hypothetical protein